MLNFDVVIIGCGVAGMTSAIYLKRANINACIIERNAPGGQLNMIVDINNYPGFKSIDGPSLAFNIFSQVKDLGITYKYANAIEIINEKDYKIVKTDKGDITCKGVIIANGRRPKELGINNEKELLGRGISYCSLCDGTLYKDKTVSIVGGGNTALESALYLSDICKDIYLIHRKNEFRGEKLLHDEIDSKNNIKVIYNRNIVELIKEDNKLSKIKLDNEDYIECDALFVNIGNIPMVIKCNDLKLDNGYIIVDQNMKTNIDKIYACGDIIKKDIYQISTAIAEACIASINIAKDISK